MTAKARLSPWAVRRPLGQQFGIAAVEKIAGAVVECLEHLGVVGCLGRDIESQHLHAVVGIEFAIGIALAVCRRVDQAKNRLGPGIGDRQRTRLIKINAAALQDHRPAPGRLGGRFHDGSAAGCHFIGRAVGLNDPDIVVRRRTTA
jgi:hypothetical protein